MSHIEEKAIRGFKTRLALSPRRYRDASARVGTLAADDEAPAGADGHYVDAAFPPGPEAISREPGDALLDVAVAWRRCGSDRGRDVFGDRRARPHGKEH